VGGEQVEEEVDAGLGHGAIVANSQAAICRRRMVTSAS
jgi:hypothetical protein